MKVNNNSEAELMVYYDTEEKKYLIDCPEQSVSGASVNALKTEKFETDPRYILALEVHSHNTMNGYFSGIDDRDEKADRVYMVIGTLNNKTPSFSLRAGGDLGRIEKMNLDKVFTISTEEFTKLDEIPVEKFPIKWLAMIKKPVQQAINKDNWRSRFPGVTFDWEDVLQRPRVHRFGPYQQSFPDFEFGKTSRNSISVDHYGIDKEEEINKWEAIEESIDNLWEVPDDESIDETITSIVTSLGSNLLKKLVTVACRNGYEENINSAIEDFRKG